jgi:acyl transferase domain-containing protein/acyl-CoA synthetase (AMP-forming)/AMP-acid ligase II/acyl carrier protein
MATLVDLVRHWADVWPEREALRFLSGETVETTMTYGELDRQARTIAAHLGGLGASGERALLLYPPGLDYVAGFLGCLYAGVVAVPAYPPMPDRSVGRLTAITADATPALVLGSGPLLPAVRAALADDPHLTEARWVATTDVDPAAADGWHAPALRSGQLAFLQYTSGSTATPRGVMVRHDNLLANERMISHAFQIDQEAVIVGWLPIYHDMGLIGTVLQALYVGGRSVLLSPLEFLKRPRAWLQAISRHGGTVSGGPNFGYELCLRKIAPDERDGLDLSRWRVAFNGAEPVRAESLERFASFFAPCRLRRAALFPCYGLAEATLFVSGPPAGTGATMTAFDTAALEEGRALAAPAGAGARPLVGCGRPWLEGRVVIVDPERREPCPPGRIGEIWVAGPHVAGGYWRRPTESAEQFAATLADGDGPLLRTGDLGFVHGGELYVTGRRKDLLIIRGRNHYPQDLELTAERAHPALRPGGGAAFGVEVDGEERLAVVQEVERGQAEADLDEAVGRVRQALAEEHDLDAVAIVLIGRGTMPKTSSGKLQRRACQELFLAGRLAVVRQWTLPPEPAPARAATTPGGAGRAEIEGWLAAQLAARLRVAVDAIDPDRPFGWYGLSSRDAVALAAALEGWLGRPVEPTIAYEHPTVRALARHLAGETAAPTPVPGGAARPAAAPAEPIAVIGIGCRLPGGVDGPEAFWRLLRDGVDAVTEVPPDRWDALAWYSPDPGAPGKATTRWGAFLTDVRGFDAGFFGITPREAEEMDPQQRLLLEVAWEALEHAGQAPDRLAGSRGGVFVGISTNDYARLGATLDRPERIGAYWATGNALSIAANRLSYLLGLRGPSLAVDTACSSSLVAVHLAVQSLRRGECGLALAGGVNVILSPEAAIGFSRAGMMAADGRCKAFAADADGFVRGEGCGLVVLKRLTDAVTDGDRVLAVIRGTAVNQDGTTAGLTAPSLEAQRALVRDALADAGVSPAEVAYVEAHGTGTRLGDPIEVRALLAALGEARTAPLLVGSVKTNLGHLEAAAGIAGLAKTVLALERGEIPPSLHLRRPNPAIDSDRVVIPTAPTRWPAEARRVAGVSSFGFGGTNAHAVLEAAPPEPAPADGPDRPLHLLRVAARSEPALRELAGRYRDRLAGPDAPALADACFTAATGRAREPWRVSVVAGSPAEAADRLAAWLDGRAEPSVRSGLVRGGEPPRVAFLFTGQGAQYAGMAAQLYQTQPRFREVLDHCDALLRPRLDRPLLSVLYPRAGQPSPIDQTGWAQPALFAVEYALAALWRSLGVEPAAVLGHSVGEYVAATVAGVLDLEDGLELLAERARLMQQLPRTGRMAAVVADAERVHAAVKPYRDRVAVAAENGPRATVVSGEREAVAAVIRDLEAAGATCRDLHVSHAFHSPLVDPILDAFQARAARVAYAEPRLPVASGLTGRLVDRGTMSHAGYWRRQLREPVRFASAMAALGAAGCEAFVEVGPANVLLPLGRRCLPAAPGPWVPTLRPGRTDWEQLLHSLAELDLHGVELDWAGLDRGHRRRKVALPTSAWRHRRYWTADPVRSAVRLDRDHQGHPLLGHDLGRLAPLPGARLWEQVVDGTLPVFEDHKVAGTSVAPLSLFLGLARAASRQALGVPEAAVRELVLHRPLAVGTDGHRVLQVSVVPDGVDAAFAVHSRPGRDGDPDAAWTLHATARLEPAGGHRAQRGGAQ